MEPQTLPDDIFYCMFAGDLRLEKIISKSIFLVGETRVGKSTLFNYLLGAQLIGRADAKNKFKINYENLNEGVKAAGGFGSVTLIPNIISDIKIHDKPTNISLCDMAGYKDRSRSYVGVYSVSYMLKQAFLRAKDVQLILVIDHASIFLSHIEELIKPFVSFIEMFKRQYLLQNEQIRKKLFDSVSIVVTKAKVSCQQILMRVNQIALDLEENQGNEKLVKQLLQNIIKHERLQIFESAKKDQRAQPSKILENLEKKNWKTFSFQKDIESTYIVELPFKRDHGSLGEEGQRLFKEAYTKKQDSFKEVQGLLSSFISTAISSWHNSKINYSSNFEQVRQFLKKYNIYNKTVEQMKYIGFPSTKGVSVPQSVNRINLLQRLKNMAEATNKISVMDSSNENTIQKLKDLKNITKDLLKLFYQTFCENQNQEKTFVLFVFTVIRGIQELAEIKAIEESLGSVFFLVLKDKLQSIFTDDINNIIVKFILEFKPKDEQLDDFQKVVEDFIQDRSIDMQNPDDLPKIYQIQIKIKIKKGNYYIDRRELLEAIKKFISANENLEEYKKIYLASVENQQPSPKVLDLIEARTIEIYQKIGKSLEQLKCFREALNIYDHLKCIQSQNSCFQKLILESMPNSDRYSFMKQFATLCEQNGRLQKAIVVYQKMMKQFTYMPKKRNQIREKLAGCLNNQQKDKSYKYIEELTNYRRIQNNVGLMLSIKEKIDPYIEMQSDEEKEENDDIFEEEYKEKIVVPLSQIM